MRDFGDVSGRGSSGSIFDFIMSMGRLRNRDFEIGSGDIRAVFCSGY
jgi:hypothetical protein